MIQLKAFHGTSWENGQSILCEKNFRAGASEKLRMGVGAYFFCQAGSKSDYAIRCARELEKYHWSQGKHNGKYAILSCEIECDEESYLDLYDPETLEYFHQMRYIILDKSLSADPNYKYQNASVADTQVFNVIRAIRQVGVIRCPQYFGMLAEESKFVFHERPTFPKTYVPNVIMACVDTKIATIRNIELVEEGSYSNEYDSFI
jgi:hypothetical protein